MEQHRTNNLTQKRPGIISISFSGIAFTVLCAYLALIALNYVEWIPISWVSLSLYGFVVLTALAICVRGSAVLEKHTIWYAAFCAVCAVSCLYSVSVKDSIFTLTEAIKILLFSLMFMNMVNSEKRIRIAMWVITVSVVLLFFYLSATGQLEVEGRLGQDLTGNANAFASIFMIGAFCSVYFVYFSEKKTFQVLALIVFLLQMYAIALAGSRKFFLMPVTLLGLLKIFSTDKTGRKQLLRNLIISASILIATWWALFNVDFLYEAIGHRMEGMIAAITGKGEAEASAEVRMEMIKKGIELWLQSPLIGYGINSYKVLGGFYTYSHNNYAELLSGLGILGAVVYYWFTPSLASQLIKAKQMGVKRWYWVITLFCILVYEYGAVTYYSYHVHIMMMLANISLRLQNKTETID